MNTYPSLDPANYGVRGLEWPIVRKPEWSNDVRTATSGKQVSDGFWPYPRWHWTISYSILNDMDSDLYQENIYTDLKTIEGFFLGQRGSLLKFLLLDPSDNTVVGQPIGTGDGTTTDFQMVRNDGPFLDAVQQPFGNPNINVYVSSVIQNTESYTIGPTGILAFGFAPVNAAAITADFSYYFPARFEKDTLEFSEFMFDLWELKQVDLVSVRL